MVSRYDAETFKLIPGIHVAEKSLYINIARIMWGFDIQKLPGEKGNWNVIEPEKGAFNIPKEVPVVIRPRSAKHEKVLREEWEESKRVGLHYSPAPRVVFSKTEKL
jgi:hypothetical protein